MRCFHRKQQAIHLITASLQRRDFKFYKMAVSWRSLIFPFLLLTLSSVYPSCASPPSQQRASSYRNFLSFTRGIRTRVQQLLRRYKEQALGDRDFEDRTLELDSLPSLSTNFHSWLQVKDWERLAVASRDLHSYWDHLDQKRQQMEQETETADPIAGHGSKLRSWNPPALTQSFARIQMDLSDLIKQVNFQLSRVNISSVNTTSPPVLTISTSPTSSTPPPKQSLWISRLEGYVILRDLELYLVKLARDFLLLASKHNDRQGRLHREG